MLKDNGQIEMDLSPYQGLYDAIIPKNHILRRLKENIDGEFEAYLKQLFCDVDGYSPIIITSAKK